MKYVSHVSCTIYSKILEPPEFDYVYPESGNAIATLCASIGQRGRFND